MNYTLYMYIVLATVVAMWVVIALNIRQYRKLVAAEKRLKQVINYSELAKTVPSAPKNRIELPDLDEDLSNCCAAPTDPDRLICSACLEHCALLTDEE